MNGETHLDSSSVALLTPKALIREVCQIRNGMRHESIVMNLLGERAYIRLFPSARLGANELVAIMAIPGFSYINAEDVYYASGGVAHLQLVFQVAS